MSFRQLKSDPFQSVMNTGTMKVSMNSADSRIVAKNKKFYVQAGAGIVADSNPIKEYEETVNKAKALMNALR